MSVKKMIAVLILLVLPSIGCYKFLQNILYPADQYLALPNGGEVRLYCMPTCPSHDNIRLAMSKVDEQIRPYLDYSPYERWENYAITFRDEPLYYKEQQVLGATLHNSNAIAIWYPYECDGPKGVCSGVLGWELKLSAIEKELPNSSEQEKLNWLTDRNIQNIKWYKSEFNNQ